MKLHALLKTAAETIKAHEAQIASLTAKLASAEENVKTASAKPDLTGVAKQAAAAIYDARAFSSEAARDKFADTIATDHEAAIKQLAKLASLIAAPSLGKPDETPAPTTTNPSAEQVWAAHVARVNGR